MNRRNKKMLFEDFDKFVTSRTEDIAERVSNNPEYVYMKSSVDDFLYIDKKINDDMKKGFYKAVEYYDIKNALEVSAAYKQGFTDCLMLMVAHN